MFLLLLIITIHEYGHLFFGLLVGFKNPIIHIYPFGGITIFNERLNTHIYKELLSLIGGILFQLLFFLLIYKMYTYNYVSNHTFQIISKINYILISFNFMMIIPLDGGRLLNIILDLFLPYKLSMKITIIISIIFSLIFVLSDISLFRLFLFIFLIKNIIIEFNNIDLKYNRFLFERYLYKYKFNRIIFINNINNFKRDYNHFINNVYESKFLDKIFDKTNDNMLKYWCL